MSKITFLSEGKNYWSTFKPIVEALIAKEVYFSYYTLDKKDPALKIQSQFLMSKYLGWGAWGYYKASTIEVDILVSTTPNIGNPRFPIKRPASVKKLIHVFHSIADISVYKIGSLDFYDTVIMTGDFQADSIRKVEQIKGLAPKKLISLGVPYLDELAKEVKPLEKPENTKTVLIGSSWGTKGCLNSYGVDFIKDIATAGYNVIVRPHPQSFVSEKKIIKSFKKELSGFSNIEWDETVSPSNAMNRADILVSDTSSIRFDFAFIYQKPVITLSIKSEEMPGYERDFLDKIWSDEAETNIGIVLNRESVMNITPHIEKVLSEYTSDKIISFRDEVISNFGNSGEEIASFLMQEIGK
jgi:hypothetical protein